MPIIFSSSKEYQKFIQLLNNLSSISDIVTFHSENQQVQISSYNDKEFISTNKLDFNIESSGSIEISKILPYLKILDYNECIIYIKNNKFYLTSELYILIIEHPSSFLSEIPLKLPNNFQVNQYFFNNTIQVFKKCLDKSDKGIFDVVHIKNKNNKFILTGTDTYRFIELTLLIDDLPNNTIDLDIYIIFDRLVLAHKIFSKDIENIDVYFDDKYIIFSNVNLNYLFIREEFKIPDFNKMLEKIDLLSEPIQIKQEDLLKQVKLAELASKDSEFSQYACNFILDNEKLNLSNKFTKDNEFNKNIRYIEINSLLSKPLCLLVNIRLFKEIIELLENVIYIYLESKNHSKIFITDKSGIIKCVLALLNN